MKRRSKAGGEPVKGRRRKTRRPKRRNAPKAVVRSNSPASAGKTEVAQLTAREQEAAASERLGVISSSFGEHIAIENARLLEELRQRTTDLTEALEQQTATSEVLGTISSSLSEIELIFTTMLAKAVRICEAAFERREGRACWRVRVEGDQAAFGGVQRSRRQSNKLGGHDRCLLRDNAEIAARPAYVGDSLHNGYFPRGWAAVRRFNKHCRTHAAPRVALRVTRHSNPQFRPLRRSLLASQRNHAPCRTVSRSRAGAHRSDVEGATLGRM